MKLHNSIDTIDDGYLLLLTSNTHVKSIMIYKVYNNQIRCIFGEYTSDNRLFNINPQLCNFFDFTDIIGNLSTYFFILEDDEILTNVLIPIL